MKLSGLVIVLNDAAVLARCLSSMSPYVDELIIIDGGSTDDSIEIAKTFGNVFVFEHPFPGHFAQQRNIGIEHTTGDWIFSLDCDEFVDLYVSKNLRYLCTRDKEVDAYSFVRVNIIDDGLGSPFSDDRQTRLFRKECRYEGQKHESIANAKNTKDLFLPIYHVKTSAMRDEDNFRVWNMGQFPTPGWIKNQNLNKWLRIDDQVPSDYTYEQPNQDLWEEETKRRCTTLSDIWLFNDEKEAAILPVISEDLIDTTPTERWFVEKLISSAPITVMEIGCGTGRFLFWMVKNLNSAKFTALDVSSTMIARVAEGMKLLGLTNIELLNIPIEEYTTTRGFDIIVCCECLEHIYNVREVVRKISTMCNTFYGSVPYGRWGGPTHLHIFNEESTTRLLSEFFSIAECDIIWDGYQHHVVWNARK